MDWLAIILILCVVAAAGCAVFCISIYNRLVRLRQNREQAFADVDVQMIQRYDLIPQLVETVKGYAKHEEQVLRDVILARENGLQATSISDKIKADATLSNAIRGLNVKMESYPDLKASGNFMQLQMEISDTENKLAAARRFFNSATKEYNTACQMFPNCILAKRFGHNQEDMYSIEYINLDRVNVNRSPNVKF